MKNIVKLISSGLSQSNIYKGDVWGIGSEYTPRGHGCRIYNVLILVDSKALKRAHSGLCNYFSNAAIGKNQPLENRSRDRAKYMLRKTGLSPE